MQERLNQLMEEHGISFSFLAQLLGIDKRTLTKKMIGTLEFTFPEMEKLIELFCIEDPQSFFFD